MNGYQLKTRIRHFFVAKHWRGHGVHSPMVYSLVREVIMRCSGKDLARELIFRLGEHEVMVVDNVTEISQNISENRAHCVILREPFRSKEQQTEWEQLYEREHCTALHCQGWLIVFFDPKLQKQYFCIRN